MENHRAEEAREVGAKLGSKGVDVRTITIELEFRFGRSLSHEEGEAMFTGWRSTEADRVALYHRRQERLAAEVRVQRPR
jgi:hypothetical protein